MTSPTKTKQPISPVFTFCCAVTCGVLGALVSDVLLSRWFGIHIADMLQVFGATGRVSARQAAAWWTIPGVSLLVGIIVTSLMSSTALIGGGTRALRWVIGALIVYGLAEIGHIAEPPHNIPAGIQLAAMLVALCVAALTAMIGAFFALRR